MLLGTKANIIGDYMELVTQFGFICLFSEVFPPAALCSFICNFIKMKKQISDFKFTRRFKAEVSNGIGTFMDCLQILTQISIMSNCALLFWTSRYFRATFISKFDCWGTETRGKIQFFHVNAVTTEWTPVDYLKVVVYIEHVIILFQIIVQQASTDVTPYIIRGERDRATLL